MCRRMYVNVLCVCIYAVCIMFMMAAMLLLYSWLLCFYYIYAIAAMFYYFITFLLCFFIFLMAAIFYIYLTADELPHMFFTLGQYK